MNDDAFRRHARRLVLAWLALLVLMFTSLASAYVPLGWGNTAAGLAIAAAKSVIVLLLFMGFARASVTVRLAAGVALATSAILYVLSGVDYATRNDAPAMFQQPQQQRTTVRTSGPASRS